MATTISNGLTPAKIELFRTKLEEKAAEIQGSLRSARTGEAFGEPTSNLEDLPVQSHEEWIFLNRNSIDVALLREIQESIERIKDGSYGLCLECEEPISLKRLQAIPWARFCVTCQEELAAEREEEALKAQSRR